MYQELLEDPGTGDDYKPTTISNQRRCGGNEKAITRIHLSYPILDGWASGRWWEGVVSRLGKAFLEQCSLITTDTCGSH